MRVPIRKRLAPGRTQKSLQIPIMRCSAVASLLAYFFSRRQARSRFYRALLAGISNALHSRIAALLRERYWRNWCKNKGQNLLSTVRNVFLKTDRSCRRIDHRCCCGESVSTISSEPSLLTTPLLRFGFTDCARTKGKSEVKRAAFSELRLNPYSSRMFFDHHLCNVESKSYTATILVM